MAVYWVIRLEPPMFLERRVDKRSWVVSLCFLLWEDLRIDFTVL